MGFSDWFLSRLNKPAPKESGPNGWSLTLMESIIAEVERSTSDQRFEES